MPSRNMQGEMSTTAMKLPKMVHHAPSKRRTTTKGLQGSISRSTAAVQITNNMGGDVPSGLQNSATSAERKRKRPSYVSSFPPLDEFGGSSSNEPDNTKAIRNVGEPLRTGTDQHIIHMRSVVAPLQPAKSALATIPFRVDPSHVRRIGAPVSSVGSEKAQNDSPIRCNRCILQRRKCDSARPVCGLCMERGAKCVYDKTRITRAYLENMQKCAESMRVASANVRQADPRQRMGEHVYPSVQRPERGPPQAEGMLTSPSQQYAKQSPWQGGPELSYDYHVAFMTALDNGRAIGDGGLFNDTTRIFDEFNRSEGSFVDEMARQQYAGLKLIWPQSDPAEHNGPEGLLSSLRVKAGLTPER